MKPFISSLKIEKTEKYVLRQNCQERRGLMPPNSGSQLPEVESVTVPGAWSPQVCAGTAVPVTAETRYLVYGKWRIAR